MSRRDDDEEWGVDGDASPMVAFQANNAGMPWLRSGIPPWHMWGTTELVTTASQGSAITLAGGTASQQLSRVSYKRPDTWRFLFYARIVSGPINVGGVYEASVDFDLVVGVGRASVGLPVFERFLWTWNDAAIPLAPVWSTMGRQPPRVNTSSVVVNNIETISAQDVQCNARVGHAVVSGSGLGVPLLMEVGCFFGPNTHVRPDWYQQRVVPEAQFTGEETQGR